MRRALVILFSFTYLIMSTGFITNTHICSGAGLSELSLFNKNSNDNPCPVCLAKNKLQKTKKKDCCKHESKIIRITEKEQKTPEFKLPGKLWGDAPPHKFLGAVFESTDLVDQTTNVTHYKDLPPLTDTPLFILHCIYRI